MLVRRAIPGLGRIYLVKREDPEDKSEEFRPAPDDKSFPQEVNDVA
jgi:hypothetical protein